MSDSVIDTANIMELIASLRFDLEQNKHELAECKQEVANLANKNSEIIAECEKIIAECEDLKGNCTELKSECAELKNALDFCVQVSYHETKDYVQAKENEEAANCFAHLEFQKKFQAEEDAVIAEIETTLQAPPQAPPRAPPQTPPAAPPRAQPAAPPRAQPAAPSSRWQLENDNWKKFKLAIQSLILNKREDQREAFVLNQYTLVAHHPTPDPKKYATFAYKQDSADFIKSVRLLIWDIYNGYDAPVEAWIDICDTYRTSPYYTN